MGNEAVDTEKTAKLITRAGSTPSIAGDHRAFTGNVRIDMLFTPNDDAEYAAAYVTFEPGARTFWHTHPAGQRLMVTYGCGLIGTEDGRVEEIKTGDVVWFPSGLKHWHRASPTTGMTHLALTGEKDGSNVTWLEEVSDKQYHP